MMKINMTDSLYELRNYILEDLIKRGYKYIARDSDGKNYIRHFYKYDEENDRVVLYAGGRTSFTEKGIIETCPEKVSIYGEEELGEEKELSVLMV